MSNNYLDILEKLNKKSQKSLSDENLLWICGLIEKYRPRRILEVGVSTGGSTAVYLNCINKLNLDCKLISVDSSEVAFYKEGKPLIGSEVYELSAHLNLENFELKTGKLIPEIVDELGVFDMIILDTVHFLPGEVLDVLCLKNNVSKNTVLVLDDINIESRYPNLYKENLKGVSCNLLILSSLKGELLFPNVEFPEIGGIVLSGDDFDEERLLLCLCHKWNSDILEFKEKYFSKIKKLYGKEFLEKLEVIYEKYKFSNFNEEGR